MNFKKILINVFILAIGQELLSTASAGTGALVKQIGTKSIVPYVAPASSLITSKTGAMTVSSINGPSVDGAEIPKAKLAQYKDAMKEALQYARSVSQKPIEFQRPLKYQKPIIVSASPIESKAFLDLELAKILKDKTINSTNFLQAMIALAAMFGYYKFIDFLNDLYENNTILMWAVEADNLKAVEYLLDFGADIDKKNSDGDTAMLIAARFGNAKIVELLINKTKEKYPNDPEKAEREVAKLINTKNQEGRTALLDVVEYGNFLGGKDFADPTEKGRIDIIKLFLENQADLSVQDNKGDNVLFLLINKMNVIKNDKDSQILREIFEVFEAKDPSILDAVNYKNENLLNIAVINDDIYSVNFLRNKNINVMNVDIYGQNILFQAVSPKLEEALKTKKVIKRGWIINKEEKEFFIKHNLKTKNLNMVKTVFNLLEENLTQEFKKRQSTDSKSSSDIKKSVAEALKEILTIKDKKGATVLDIATFYYTFPMVQLLVEKGAEPTKKQFSTAVSKEKIDIVKLFLEKSKLSPSMDDLLETFNLNNINLMKLLLNSKYLDPSIKNKFVEAAYLGSLKQKNIEMFDLLLPMVDSSVKNKNIKDILVTGDRIIINNFLNSSQITDETRREMLKEAVESNLSEQTIETLLSNPLSQKAYEDPIFRSFVLKAAVNNIKIGDVKGAMSKESSINKQDLINDPVLRSLLTAFEPQYQEGWNTVLSDKLAALKGQPASKDIFKDKQKSFLKEIDKIIVDTNKNRAEILKKQTPKEAPKKSWQARMDEMIRAFELMMQ